MTQDDLVKIVKKLFSGIFTFLYFLLLNVLLIIFVLKSALSNNLVKDVLDYNNEYYNKVDNSTIAYVDPTELTIDNVDNIPTDNIEDELILKIEKLLESNNLPIELIGYISNTEYNQDEYNKIYENAFNFVLGVDKELKFPRGEISKILDKAIAEYEKDSNEIVNRSGITNFINETEKLYKEYIINDEVINIRDMFYTVLFGAIYHTILTFTIILLVAIILLNLNNLKFLLKISIPHIITGITYLSVSYNLKEFITTKDGFMSLFNAMKSVGIIVLVIGLIGLGTYYLLKYTRQKEEDIYA